MLNMNCRPIIRKFMMILIALLIIAFTFRPHSQECMAKEVNSYQGKVFSLYGKEIGGIEFFNYIKRVTNQANQNGIKLKVTQIWDSALTMAVNNLALQQEISKHRSEIIVTDEEAEALIGKYFPTEEELNNFMLFQGFPSKAAFVNTVVQEMEYEKLFLIKAREFKMEVTEAEVRAELEQIHVRHILIGFQDSDGIIQRTSDQALARAEEVYRKVIAGGDFEQLAAEYSDDPGSKQTGDFSEPCL